MLCIQDVGTAVTGRQAVHCSVPLCMLSHGHLNIPQRRAQADQRSCMGYTFFPVPRALGPLHHLFGERLSRDCLRPVHTAFTLHLRHMHMLCGMLFV